MEINYVIFLFFLVLTLVVVVNSRMRISVSQNIVQTNSQWTRILLSITGGTKPYQLFYSQLPDGWKQVNNYIYIPKQTRNSNSKYPLKVIIKDSSDNQLKSTVVFKIRKDDLQIQTQLYPFEYTFADDFFTSDDFQGKPKMIQMVNINQRIDPKQKQKQIQQTKIIQKTIQQMQQMIVTPGSGLKKMIQTLIPNTEDNISQQIQKVMAFVKTQTQQKSQKRQIQQIFSDLPSAQQIDQIILQGDSFSIIKTIQIVVRKQNLTCDQKIVYLSNFFGRIQSAVNMKIFTLSQLKIIIQGAQNEIIRLENQIQFAFGQIDALQISKLQKLIFQQLAKLEIAYDKFNQNYQKIKPNQQDLQEQNLKFTQLKQDQQKNNQNLNIKKLQLQQAIAKIQRLEKELQNARLARDFLQQQIINIQGVLRSIQFQLNTVQRNIQRIQFIITRLRDKSDILKNQYSQIQIAVQRLRNDIIRNLFKQQQLFDLVDELNRRKRVQQRKAALRQQRMLQNFIRFLSNTLPNIQEQINKIYYDCFNVSDVTTRIQGGKVVYLMSLRSFLDYLKNTYQLQNVQRTSIIQQITLTPIHILDREWKQKFGQPYSDTVVASSKEFRFSSDFSCLNPSTLENGQGKIINIQKNVITAQSAGLMVYLQLSSCSRIQSTTVIPNVGQTIYWKGNQSNGNQQNVIEVYSATCA